MYYTDVKDGSGYRLPVARWVWTLCVGLAFSLLWRSDCLQAEDGPSQNSIWEISSRNLPESPVDLDAMALHTLELQGNRWQPASMAGFLQSQASAESTTTIIYVHGNWTTTAEARQRGLMVYHACRQRAAGPIRFVIYSWPSEREEGFARDVISKKTRLAADGYYLASLIRQLDANTHVGVLGFSFGGAVVCGALHLDAGGNLDGRSMPLDKNAARTPVRVSLTAPAFDRNALSRGGKYEFALARTEKVVNLYNSIDPVLKRFRFYERHSSPVAAGFAGILEVRRVGNQSLPTAGELPLTSNAKIVQYDCGGAIGRTHAELSYLEHCPAFGRSIENLLGF